MAATEPSSYSASYPAQSTFLFLPTYSKANTALKFCSSQTLPSRTAQNPSWPIACEWTPVSAPPSLQQIMDKYIIRVLILLTACCAIHAPSLIQSSLIYSSLSGHHTCIHWASIQHCDLPISMNTHLLLLIENSSAEVDFIKFTRRYHFDISSHTFEVI